MTLPTSSHMCGDCVADLGSYVDGELTPDRAAALDGHLASCASCAGVRRDLDRLRAAARALGPIDPPAHVWLEIAGQVRLDAAAQPAPHMPRRSRSRAPMYQWIGIAATLVVTTLGVYVLTTRTPSAPVEKTPAITTAGNVQTPVTVESVEDDLRKAEELYTNAIAKLEVIAKSDNGALTPVVAAKLQKSLTTIDQAIAESRTALNQHPENASARDSLFEALRRKVGVLQDTVALINVMRNGDQAGAAQLVGRKSSS